MIDVRMDHADVHDCSWLLCCLLLAVCLRLCSTQGAGRNWDNNGGFLNLLSFTEADRNLLKKSNEWRWKQMMWLSVAEGRDLVLFYVAMTDVKRLRRTNLKWARCEPWVWVWNTIPLIPCKWWVKKWHEAQLKSARFLLCCRCQLHSWAKIRALKHISVKFPLSCDGGLSKPLVCSVAAIYWGRKADIMDCLFSAALVFYNKARIM